MKQLYVFGKRRFLSAALRCLIAIAGVVAGIAAAGLFVEVPSAVAGDLKLDSPCNQLQTTDVTAVDNAACRAISAIYIDADGKAIYFERLELDGDRLVKGRLVSVVRGCAQNDPNCSGGCGKPSCSICVGGRCGCLC